MKIGLFRPITLFPFPKDRLREVAKNKKKLIVVELNNGQMARDVELYTECSTPIVRHNWYGGMVPSVEEIIKLTEKDLVGG